MTPTLPPSRLNGNGHDRSALNDLIAQESAHQLATAGVATQPVFSVEELEQINFRRFNPYSSLTAATLSAALDAWEAGLLFTAARFWVRIAKSDPTINTVKPKREEAVALRNISTRAKDESPLALDQAAALKNFYDNVRASHATKRHIVGKESLLLEQMMESVAFEYACHHIIWKPDAAQPFALPSGKSVPTLSATFEYVPLEFFEARTGALRFLGINNFWNGAPLENFGDWLITTGPGLMFSACVQHYFARLARHDFVNYSEKFGTPGILVSTTAQQNSPEGQSALAMAQGFSSNYRAVQYGAAENKVEIVEAKGGAAGEGLPMHVLTKDIKQEIISMWLGADLSTVSRGSGIIGASVQGEEEQAKHQRDCKRMGDTLNASVDPLVLRWYFGTNTPLLAEAYVDFPNNEDRDQLIKSLQFAVSAGAQVPIEPVLERLNVPMAQEGEKTFEKAVAPAPVGAGAGAGAGGKKKESAINVALNARADLEQFLGPMRDDYLKALANDLQPLRTAMEAVLSEDDVAFNSKVAWLQGQLPSLLKEINASPKSAGALAEILQTAFDRGYSSRSTAELAATTR